MKLLLPAGFAAGAVAATILLRAAPPEYGADLAQPLVVVTYWQHFGALTFSALAGAFVLAAIGYLAALRRIPRRREIVLLCALSCAAALCFPVVFSSDVYAYAGYGWMLLHGISPYGHARLAGGDALLNAVLWQWGNPPPVCVYGPVFVAVASFAALFAPLGAAAPLWILRLLACASLVVCALFGKRRAAAIVALNPIAIWSAAEGHNDAMAIAPVLASLALAAGAPMAAALSAAIASAVKIPAALVLAAIARKNVRAALAGSVLTAVLAIPLLVAATQHLASGGHYLPQFSLQYVLALVMPAPLAIALTFVAGIALAVASRGRAAFVVFAIWLCIPNPYPWYASWLLVPAALTTRRGERAALIAASLLAPLRYYGEATSAVAAPLACAITAAMFGIPLAMLVLSARSERAHRVRRGSRIAGLDFAPGRRP